MSVMTSQPQLKVNKWGNTKKYEK